MSVTTEREDPLNPGIYQDNFVFSGNWSAGRRVYSQPQKTGDNKQFHLFIRSGITQWAISDEVPDGVPYIFSGRGPVNPDNSLAGYSERFNTTSWQFRDGEAGQEDETLSVVKIK